jgi:DnaJ-class molecular chaperone
MNVTIFHKGLEYCEHEDHDGSDHITVKGKFEVCPQCNGTGHHVRHDLDDSALVQGMEEDGDFEGLEGYFAGHFDEICRECHGKNVIPVACEGAMPEWAAKYMADWDRQEAFDRAYSEQERRMGA